MVSCVLSSLKNTEHMEREKKNVHQVFFFFLMAIFSPRRAFLQAKPHNGLDASLPITD